MGRRNKNKVVEKGVEHSGIALYGPLNLVPDNDFLTGGGSKSDYSGGMTTVPKVYANHAYVYACIRAISQNIGQVPLRVQVGTDENPKLVDENSQSDAAQLARVLYNPNENMTRYGLWESVITHMNLTGTAFWIMDRPNAVTIPRNIWVFGAECFYPVFSDKRGGLLGWMFTDSRTGYREALATHEVLTFKFFNPYDQVFGLGPIEAARRGITLDYLANAYGKSFFENSADPSGVLTTERKLTTKQMQEVRSFWEERHRGPGNAKRVGVLYGGMKYQPITVSQKDMEFIAQRQWTRDEILAVFKVPKSELSLYEDVNNATSISQNKGFWEKTLIPIVKNIEAVLADNFVVNLKPTVDKRLKLFFDIKTVPALQEQLTDKIANAEKLAKMGYPINAINKVLELGLPNVEWGDTWYVNQAVVPIDFVLDGRTTISPKPSGQRVDAPNGASDATDAPDMVDGPDQKEPPKGAKEDKAMSSLLRESVDHKIEKIKYTIKAFLWYLRKHQLTILVKNDGGVFSQEVWQDKFTKRVSPIIQEVFLLLNKDVSKADKCASSTVGNIHALVAVAVNSDNRLNEVKDLFNKLSADKCVTMLAKRELLESIKSV